MPTSRSRDPVDAIRSGRRKPSPISTSSPRLSTTSRPAASAVVGQQQRGGAVVDDQCTSPASGTARAQRRQCAPAAARAPARREVELDVDVAPPAATTASSAAARQRRAAEVGVQHHAGRVEHRRAGSRRVAGRAATASLGDALGRRSLPARARCCASAIDGLHQWRGPAPARASARRGSASSASVRGTRRRGSLCIGSASSEGAWRRRTGIEPASGSSAVQRF